MIKKIRVSYVTGQIPKGPWKDEIISRNGSSDISPYYYDFHFPDILSDVKLRLRPHENAYMNERHVLEVSSLDF